MLVFCSITSQQKPLSCHRFDQIGIFIDNRLSFEFLVWWRIWLLNSLPFPSIEPFGRLGVYYGYLPLSWLMAYFSRLKSFNCVVKSIFHFILLFLISAFFQFQFPEWMKKLKPKTGKKILQLCLRSAVKMDILLEALLILSWFLEGRSPSITYIGRWVRQNSDLEMFCVFIW